MPTGSASQLAILVLHNTNILDSPCADIVVLGLSPGVAMHLAVPELSGEELIRVPLRLSVWAHIIQRLRRVAVISSDGFLSKGD